MAQSPTMTSPGGVTTSGMILGTAAYMSPEQARGRPVDKRADIWAFGCLLFELLTGQPAFGGETVTDVLGLIVKSDPQWSLLPAATPPAVARLLRRCLQKDPARRLRDIGDAIVELDTSGTESPAALATPPLLRPARSRRQRVLLAAAWLSSLVAIAAVSATLAFRVRPAAPAPLQKFKLSIQEDGGALEPAISPDGRRRLRSQVPDLGSVLRRVEAARACRHRSGRSALLVARRRLDRVLQERDAAQGADWRRPRREGGGSARRAVATRIGFRRVGRGWHDHHQHRRWPAATARACGRR